MVQKRFLFRLLNRHKQLVEKGMSAKDIYLEMQREINGHYEN